MKRLALALVTLACVLTAALAHAQEAPVARQVLANGLTVLVRENPAVGVVAVSLQVRAGSRYETESSAGITNFLQRAMVRGTTRRGAVQLATSAEDLGGGIDANGEVEAAEIRGHALARNWEALLALVAEVALQPALPPDEIEKERRLILGQIRTRADAPFSYSLDSLLRELYGANPYGLNQIGLKASIERLTREDLLAHYRAIYQPDRMVLAVSGDVDRRAVMKTAERLFGRMARTGPGPQVAQSVPEPTGERKVVTRPAQQAQILVGYLAPGLSDPLYPAVRMLSAVLGGGMAGRLFTELRDRQGLAYSTQAISAPRVGPTFLVAYIGTAPASAAAAEAGMLREIERMRSAPVSGDELARAKAFIKGQLVMDRRTNARQAWYLAFFETIGAGWDFPDRYARALDSVTVEDVARAADRYLTRPTIFVLQPAARR